MLGRKLESSISLIFQVHRKVFCTVEFLISLLGAAVDGESNFLICPLSTTDMIRMDLNGKSESGWAMFVFKCTR